MIAENPKPVFVHGVTPLMTLARSAKYSGCAGSAVLIAETASQKNAVGVLFRADQFNELSPHRTARRSNRNPRRYEY